MKVAARHQSRTLEDRTDEINRRARWGGRFEHDETSLSQMRHDGFGRGGHGAHVRFFEFDAVRFAQLAFMERGWHGDDVGVGGFGRGGKGEPSRFERGLEFLAQARLVDVDVAAAQGFEDARADVHAEDAQSVRGEGRGGGQADVAEADDADVLEVHLVSVESLVCDQELENGFLSCSFYDLICQLANRKKEIL